MIPILLTLHMPHSAANTDGDWLPLSGRRDTRRFHGPTQAAACFITISCGGRGEHSCNGALYLEGLSELLSMGKKTEQKQAEEAGRK